MLEKPKDQYIIDCLNIHYGINVSTLTYLPLGADSQAAVYKAKTHGGSAYFVKIKQGHHHDISITLLQLLHDKGIQQVILPIKTKQGQPSQRIDEFTLTLYPFIKAEDGFHRHLTVQQWIKLGEVMRKVHEMVVPPSIQHIIRRETFSPKWREIVRALYAHIESNPNGDETALKLMLFMQTHKEQIEHLVERAQALSKKIKNLSHEFVLCHSDIHGGNVLVKGDDTIYVVDWDEPMMAPKERDLMFIGGGVANVWNKPQEEAFFYQGYGKTDIDMKALAYYRHERIVEDIAIYGQQLLLNEGGGEKRIQLYQHFIEQFETDGVVEIAFRTDDYNHT